MCIFPIVSKDEVGRNALFQLLKNGLQFTTHKRHESIGKSFQDGSTKRRRSREKRGRAAGFFFTRADCAEDDPMKYAVRVLLRKAENCAAAPDFDVVGMGAEAKNLQFFGGLRGKVQLDHRSAETVSESRAMELAP